MKSEFFSKFGIPDIECEVEAAVHPTFGLPMVFFRSEGNPLVGLDLGGATQLEQMFEAAGQAAHAAEMRDHIAKARRLYVSL